MTYRLLTISGLDLRHRFPFKMGPDVPPVCVLKRRVHSIKFNRKRSHRRDLLIKYPNKHEMASKVSIVG